MAAATSLLLLACVTLTGTMEAEGSATMTMGDINEQVAQIDIERATFDDVKRVFGEPQSYQWGREIFAPPNLPTRFCMMYRDGFVVMVVRGQAVELRHHEEGPGYRFRDAISVGSTLEEVLAVVGQPTNIVDGEKCGFEDGVLYLNIEGTKGRCYYQRNSQNVRFFFWNDRVNALYTMRSTSVSKAEIPDESVIDEKGRIRDRIDYPFVDEPDAVGSWKAIDFVKKQEQFEPGTMWWKGDLYLKTVELRHDGTTSGPWTWTRGLLIHPKMKTAARYRIEEMEGGTYMFFEWKSGDYTRLGKKPSYYVLRKL